MTIIFIQVEQSTLDFEKHLIPLFLSANTNEVGLKAFVNIARSFNDIASENILSDTPMVMIGFSIVFTFMHTNSSTGLPEAAQQKLMYIFLRSSARISVVSGVLRYA